MSTKAKRTAPKYIEPRSAEEADLIPDELVPTIPRQPWHRPTDMWQVTSDIGSQSATPTRPEANSGYDTWAMGIYKGPRGEGNVFGPKTSVPANQWATLRRIVPATKAEPRKYKAEEAKRIAAEEKAARAKKRAELAAARKRKAELAKLPKKARDVVALLDADRDAFGCQRRSVIKLVSAILGCDLSSVAK